MRPPTRASSKLGVHAGDSALSDSTGIPVILDNDANASPRGAVIRFHLATHTHTDIIAHSVDGFPTRTGEEFLEFLRAVAASSDSSTPHPTLIEAFLGAHPKALEFVQAKLMPSSFARETYFGITAMRFTNRDRVSRYGRYRIVPEGGNDYLDEAAATARGANFLFDELADRIASGPVKFRILVQLASDGDIVNDATVHWPQNRPLLELGTVVLTEAVWDDADEQKKIIFDPIPRIDGIDPSDDPLLELRAAIYLLSGRRRRAASEADVQAERKLAS